MVPSAAMFDTDGTLTVLATDGELKQLPVRCRIGQLYMAQTDSPNFNAKVGGSIFFSLTGEASGYLRSMLGKDDTRIVLTANGAGYEVSGAQDHGDFFKCPAVRCKEHGDKWV